MSLKKGIKKLINKIKGIPSGMMKPWYDELYAKTLELNNSRNIKTLSLGSSHGAYGFYAAKFSDNAFNLSSTSQDLYSSFELSKSLPDGLEKLIIFYSVFSPGYEVQKTKDFQVCAYLKAFLNIPYKYPDLKKAELDCFASAAKKITSQKSYQKIRSEQGYLFSTFHYPPDIKLFAERRAETHLRENLRNTNQTEYLKSIKEICDKDNISLYVVMAPAHVEYKNNLPPSSELFKDLFTLAKKYDINIINLYDNDSFEGKDFGDFDHLNQEGAEKLTLMLKDYIGA
ncbi:MAG: hypothetical protein LBL47_00225 [Lactobacillus sp.]|jgi:hypothetical protein|nr:hypothetical protein [Lactobacillus sp.]